MNETLLNQFPQEIQDKIIRTLANYREVTVEYEYGRWTAVPACCLKASYGDDYKVWFVKDTDIYTKEELDIMRKEVREFNNWWSEELNGDERWAIYLRCKAGEEDADWKEFRKYQANKQSH